MLPDVHKVKQADIHSPRHYREVLCKATLMIDFKIMAANLSHVQRFSHQCFQICTNSCQGVIQAGVMLNGHRAAVIATPLQVERRPLVTWDAATIIWEKK